MYESVPKELIEYDQWIVWKWETRGNGKPTKPPYDFRTGRKADKTDPNVWAPFYDAVEVLHRGYDGIGFCFCELDPFCGIDLDDCRNPVTGEVDQWAKDIVIEFDSYTEVSPSDTGLKIFIKGYLPGGGIHTKHIEVYDKGAYFTVTGRAYHVN